MYGEFSFVAVPIWGRVNLQAKITCTAVVCCSCSSAVCFTIQKSSSPCQSSLGPTRAPWYAPKALTFNVTNDARLTREGGPRHKNAVLFRRYLILGLSWDQFCASSWSRFEAKLEPHLKAVLGLVWGLILEPVWGQVGASS